MDGIAFHADVMDGKFVERVSMPFDEYIHLVKRGAHHIDLHLMIENPTKNLPKYLAKAVYGNLRSLSFHVETCQTDEAIELIEKVKLEGIQGGIVIDLPTPIQNVDPRLFAISDVVTIMSVKCGASGQTFNQPALDKVRHIRTKYPKIRVVMDGGISPSNIKDVKKAGVHTAVVASAVYSSDDRFQTIKSLQTV